MFKTSILDRHIRDNVDREWVTMHLVHLGKISYLIGKCETILRGAVLFDDVYSYNTVYDQQLSTAGLNHTEPCRNGDGTESYGTRRNQW